MSIKRGDLVMVVRPCTCGKTEGIGHAFTVQHVHLYPFDDCPCIQLGASGASDGESIWPAFRLVKIDPPAIETHEERHDPAHVS